LSVAPRGVNKGRALDYLVARHLGGRVERLVAAGNGLNDVALLRRADHRIVMPGSPRELLDLATEISDPLDEGGLTRSMTRLLLDQRR
jgi:hydroxymethylpyrimidine pyrophosphatase-like HAD family hydrolase